MKPWQGAQFMVLAGLTTGFLIGRNKGISEGFESASKAYNQWSVQLMRRDPNLRIDSILLVPNDAHVRVPQCDPDEKLSATPWRRPEKEYKDNASVKLIDGVIEINIPEPDRQGESRVAIIVGCRKKVPTEDVKDLTRSWEIPPNLR
ncbi:hypothetical protein ACO0LF_30035 [Undibacterium sp. Di27W]|uniref:hypothetical protein n=1 Tax=Undibacterium sp. Di27W TaxID=3413036 RepID=UPI003BF05538